MEQSSSPLRRGLECLAAVLLSVLVLILGGRIAWQGVSIFQNAGAVPVAASVQEVLRRRYILGQTYPEIADAVGLVLRRVYQIHRAGVLDLDLEPACKTAGTKIS